MKFIVGLKLFSLPVMLSIVTREPDMLLAKLDILGVQWATVEAETTKREDRCWETYGRNSRV